MAVLVAAASITVAVVIHRQVILCSYLGGQPPPPCSRPTDYPLDLRLGIVAGGLVAAALIMAISRLARKRRKTRTSALIMVSNDTDLLSMSPWRGTPIIEPTAFAAKVDAMRRHARRRR